MGKLSAHAFQKELAKFASEQRRLIETECSGFDADPAASAIRRERVVTGDYQFFVETYFPHYTKGNPPSLFHKYLFKRFPFALDAQEGINDVIAAPRGEAKSTLLTQLGTLYAVVTGRKQYIGIIMDSFDQAAMMLEAVKAELEANPRLAQDFPEACGAGRVWQTGVVVTKNNRKIQAAGSGKRLRGWRHGPHRPDLVFLDDIENDENVRKKEQRDKTERWVLKAVMNLGPPDGMMDVFYVGTVLHYDSVLNRFLKRPTWHRRVFKAVLRMPDNMKLWDEWEAVLQNESKEAALNFYQKNKRKMDKGAEVSWPDVRPIYRLMLIRANDHHSFDCEYQNDPTDEENAPFKDIQYWFEIKRHWVYYGAVDPSLGKANKSRDPSAILVGAIDRSTGVLDVVEANIKRRVPDKIIEDIIAFQREYTCMVWAFESVQFQEFLRTELVKRSAIIRVPVPARPVIPHTDKALRIESLQPHIANSLIRLHQSQKTLIEQLKHWPEAAHDDGPDALEMLWKVAISGAGGIPKAHGAERTDGVDMAGYE